MTDTASVGAPQDNDGTPERRGRAAGAAGANDGTVAYRRSGAVRVLLVGGHARIVLVGTVDVTMARELSHAALRVLRSRLAVEVDVRRVTAMDTAAVATIAWLAGLSRPRLRVIAPPPTVRELLEATELVDVVDVSERLPVLPPDVRWGSS